MICQFRNGELEQKIAQHTSAVELGLEHNELVNQHMEIIAKQALPDNKMRPQCD